jgi:ATP-binding cassette subfamily A (ABC1) protein 3
VTYTIPRAESNSFKPFFEALDERLDEYDLSSYGVSMTSLEEVFLSCNAELEPSLGSVKKNKKKSKDPHASGKKVNYSGALIPGQKVDMNETDDVMEMTGDHSRTIMKNSNSFDDVESDEISGNLIQGSGCLTTVSAAVNKRWQIYQRDYCGFICQVISPLILIFFGLLLYSAPSSLTQSPERFIGTDLYPTQQLLMSKGVPVNATGDGYDLTGEQFMANFPNMTREDPAF